MIALSRFAVHGGSASITFDNPVGPNSLTSPFLDEILRHLAEAERLQPRVLYLRSSQAAFCLGADMSEVRASGMRGIAGRLLRIQELILRTEYPVVADVRGPTCAGGLGIIRASDIVVASESASFQFSEIGNGVAPSVVSLTIQPKLRPREATELIFTGRLVSGPESVHLGFATYFAGAHPDEHLTELEDRLIGGSAQGFAATKQLMNESMIRAHKEHGETLAAVATGLFASDEANRRMSASDRQYQSSTSSATTASSVGDSRSAMPAGNDGAQP